VFTEAGKDKLTEEDFVNVMHWREKVQANNLLVLEAFGVFDKDGNGYVSAAEMKQLLTTLGEPLDAGEHEEMMRGVYVDEDGHFNYEEFVKTKLNF